MSAVPQLSVDWPEVLNELRRMGIKTGQIAEFTGLSTGNIREYRLGIKRPLHSNGEMIIEFWMTATVKTRDLLPMAQRM